MNVSKGITELAEKVKKYRTDLKLIEELKVKNESLENQTMELENNVKLLKLNTIKQNKLLKEIKELEEKNKKLKLALKDSTNSYEFIVTTPTNKEFTNTVHGEICKITSQAQESILICSPWITYILEELSSFNKKERKKPINLKIITRLLKEDIDKGIFDLDKIRVLKDNFGAEIRYNNDLHAKLVITDNSTAVISSANLTKKGLMVNYEAGVCLKNKEKVNEVTEFFNELWDESKPLTQKAIKKVLSNKEQ